MTTTVQTKPIPRLVNKADDVRRIVDEIYANPDRAYTYDFETLDTRVGSLRRVGLGLAWGPEEHQSSYIVTMHDSYPYLDWNEVLDILKPMLEDDSLTQIAHNQLFDATILADDGVQLHTNTYDTMVLAWLLDTSTPNGLKKIIKSRYDYKMNELAEFADKESVAWSPNKILALHRVNVQTLADYGADDVRWTYRLWKDLLGEVRKDSKIDKIYHELYREYLNVLTYMQVDGILVDRNLLDDMAERCSNEMEELLLDLWRIRPDRDWHPDEQDTGDIDKDRKKIPALQKKWSDRTFLRPLLYEHPDLASKAFSPNSGDYLNRILFGKEGLRLRPIGEKGSNGNYSVATDVLTKLQAQDETGFVAKLMRYKTLSKLHGTYLEGLPPLIDPDGRLRTSFRATLQTGRLSSSDPNLQNIVNNDDFPVRKAFVPRPGHKLVVSDQSQIELRIVAHMGKDQGMISDFRNGVDPHSSTTKDVFQLDSPVEAIKEREPVRRKVGKTVNFACVPVDTEALTRTGWKTYDQLVEGEEILAYDQGTDTTRWTPLREKVYYEKAPVTELRNGHLSFRSTPNHRWYGRRRTGRGRTRRVIEGVFTTEEITSEHILTMSAPMVSEGTSAITPQEAAVIAWLHTDGHIKRAEYTGRTSQAGGSKVGFEASIFQKKGPQLEKIRALLEKVPHTVYERSTGIVQFALAPQYSRDLWKKALLDEQTLEQFVLTLSSDAVNAFAEAAWDAEGWTDAKGARLISQNAGEVLDALTTAVFLTGHTPSVYSGRDYKDNVNHQVRYGKRYLTGQRLDRFDLEEQPVWCVRTDLETWVMRQGERMTITGNTLYGAGSRTVRDWVIAATNGEISPSLDEVDGWISNFFAAKSGVKGYIKTQEMRAEQEGLVRTILGRPRHLPEARGGDMKKRGAALRQAVNTPIQGSAADILALAMRNIVRVLGERGWYRTRVWLLLQVHDEVVLEAEEEIAEEVAELVTREMEQVVKLSVPLEAETKIADTWYDGK